MKFSVTISLCKAAMRLLLASCLPAPWMLTAQETPPRPADVGQPSPATGSPAGMPFGSPLKPLTVGGKAEEVLEPAFGPRALFSTAVFSGIRMATVPSQYPHEWRAGAEGYGHLYGDSYARSAASAIGRFSAAAILHEDPRYRRSESSSVTGRIAHAFAYTLVDRTDGGRRTLAFSNFAGATAEGFVGKAYLPRGYDDATHAGQRSLSAFAPIAAQNLLQEFGPELGRALEKLHVPHIPLPPVWWGKGKNP